MQKSVSILRPPRPIRTLFGVIIVLQTICMFSQDVSVKSATSGDSVDCKAYMAALQLADPRAKLLALKSFITRHPDTKLKTNVLVEIMLVYREKGDSLVALKQAIADVLLSDANDVRALAVAVDIGRHEMDNANWPAQALQGVKALESWSKPDCMSSTEFEKARREAGRILYPAAGAAALQAHDYSGARDYYGKAQKLEPDEAQSLFQLGIAELEIRPIDVKGFWHIAKAVNVARKQLNQPAAESIAVYGKRKYKAYRGTETGWDDLIKDAANQPTVPDGFSVSPAKDL